MVVDSRPPRRRSRRLSPIVDTLPLTLAVASLIVALITFVVAAFALKVDWAKAGQLAVELDAAPGIAAIVAAGVLLLRRQARTLTLALTGALLLVLAISTLGALAWQPAIHTLQARQLEGGQQWTPALQEYTLGGERAPNAPNRARVYIEWGEADLHAHQYHDAQDHLKQGQAEDPSGTTIIAWASADLVQTYHEWLAADPQGFPYDPASTFFDTYAKSGFCAADCKQSVHSFVAQMLYTEGHDEFLGSNVCNLAVPVYQNLATNYADTPQGQQAAAALAIPIDVKLTIMNIPPGTLAASRKAYFSRALYPYVLDHVTTFSDDYQTVVDSSGNVIFHGVTPGKYNLSVLLANGGRWYWRVVDLFNPYTEIVLPLCGNEITTYNWT
ncbi:MAG TPA: hypothetical protein VF120_18470 [Ktedonobacterales bacterium]